MVESGLYDAFNKLLKFTKMKILENRVTKISVKPRSGPST